MKKLIIVLPIVMLVSSFFINPTGVAAARDESVPPRACGAYGDADHNGIITNNDAQVILQTVAGFINPSVQDRLLMDVDYDGDITATDALYINNFVNRSISTLPACASKPRVCGALGDITNDGIISKNDSDYAMLYTLGLVGLRDASRISGDVNKSGDVDSVDALLITRYVKGLSQGFPGCTPTGRN